MKRSVKRLIQSVIVLFLGSILPGLIVSAAESEREISILRLSTSELDRAISDLICLSYEVIHPLYSCSESIMEQERFSELYRARKAEKKAEDSGVAREETLSKASMPSVNSDFTPEKSETVGEKSLAPEGLKRLALAQNNLVDQDFDFIITSEQFFNAELKEDYALLLPLYQKAFTAVTRAGRADSVFDRENIFGVLNQDFQLEVARNVLSAVNLNKQEIVIHRYNEAEMMEDFCLFDINVAFVTGTHPDSLIRQLNTLCDGKPVSITRALPKDFFQRNRYLYRTTISKDYYWRLAEDIETLSARYLLAVHKRVSDERLQELLSSLMNEVLRASTVAITPEAIIQNYQNLQTSLHPLGDLIVRRDLLDEEIEPEEVVEEDSQLEERLRQSLEVEEIGSFSSPRPISEVLDAFPSLLPVNETSAPEVVKPVHKPVQLLGSP